MIESLQKYDYFFGSEFKVRTRAVYNRLVFRMVGLTHCGVQVEMPTGSGRMATLWEVSQSLSSRLIGIFKEDETGKRRVTPLRVGVAQS